MSLDFIGFNVSRENLTAYQSNYIDSNAFKNAYLGDVRFAYDGGAYGNIPRWASQSGIPATLCQLNFSAPSSQACIPYPDEAFNSQVLTSVTAFEIDSSGRMWILDSGKINFGVRTLLRFRPPPPSLPASLPASFSPPLL